MLRSVFQEITSFLDAHGVVYRVVHHQPTRTSEESAKARGESIEIGGKAIVMKVDDDFKLFVISAARKIDSQKIKKLFGAKKLRFASGDELLSLTGLVQGSVPPFGTPILPFELVVDSSIAQNEKIAFNAGSLTDSVIMQSADYVRLANGKEAEFGE